MSNELLCSLHQIGIWVLAMSFVQGLDVFAPSLLTAVLMQLTLLFYH